MTVTTSTTGTVTEGFRRSIVEHIGEQVRLTGAALGGGYASQRRQHALSALAGLISSLPLDDPRLYSLLRAQVHAGGTGGIRATYTPGPQQDRLLTTIANIGADPVEPEVALARLVCMAIDDVALYAGGFLTDARTAVQAHERECEQMRAQREDADGLHAQIDRLTLELTTTLDNERELERQVAYLRSALEEHDKPRRSRVKAAA